MIFSTYTIYKCYQFIFLYHLLTTTNGLPKMRYFIWLRKINEISDCRNTHAFIINAISLDRFETVTSVNCYIENFVEYIDFPRIFCMVGNKKIEPRHKSNNL